MGDAAPFSSSGLHVTLGGGLGPSPAGQYPPDCAPTRFGHADYVRRTGRSVRQHSRGLHSERPHRVGGRRGGVIISVTGGSHSPCYLPPHRRPGTVAHVACLPPGAQTAAQPATAATTATPATATSGLKNCQSHWHIDWQTPRPGVPATTRCAVNVLLTPVGAARRGSRRLAPRDPDETPLTRPPRHLPMDLPMSHSRRSATPATPATPDAKPVTRVGRVGLEPTTGGL